MQESFSMTIENLRTIYAQTDGISEKVKEMILNGELDPIILRASRIEQATKKLQQSCILM
jgi:hypothetical protein